MKSKIFNLSAISIIACDCLQAIICIFMDSFFISQLLTKSDGSTSMNIIFIGLFYVVYYIVLVAQYWIWGNLMKKINKSVFVTIGAVFLTLVIFLVYFLNTIPYFTVPLIAICYGIGFGFFSSGYSNLTAETISSKHQVRFFAVKRIMFQATYIIAPISIGYIISAMQFKGMALVMLIVCVALIVFSFLIRPKTSYKQTFKPVKFISYLKEHKSEVKPILWVMVSDFFRGASYDSFTTLITILVMFAFNSTTKLGTFQSIFTACSLVTMFFYLKFYRKKRAKGFILPTITLVSASIIAILGTIIAGQIFGTAGQVVIIVFYAVYAILNVILMSVSDSRRAGVVRMLSLHSHILEYSAIRETSLAVGRVVSSFAILFAGLFDMLVGNNSIIFLSIGIAFVCVMYVFYGLSLMKLEKVLVKQDEEFRQVHIAEQIEKTED